MKIRFKHSLIGLFILLSLIGCSQRMGYVANNKVLNNEKIIEKNYELNKIQSSYVGSTMIKINDYNKITKSSNAMKPSEDFIFNTDSNNQFSFSKDDIFTISGSWVIDNITYTALKHEKTNFTNLLIKADGSIHNKVVNVIPFGISAGEAVTAIYTYEHNPTSVRFNMITATENIISKGQLNYELIYTGLNGDSFMITYREYTKDDLARASFFQNLTYSKSMNQIRFRNLLIKIHSIDNEKIVFSVIEDDL